MHILAFILFTAGFLMLLSAQKIQPPQTTLKQRIKHAKQKPRTDIVSKNIHAVEQIIAVQNLPFGMNAIWGMSIALALVGIGASGIMQNYYLAPVLAVLLALVPFAAIKLRWQKAEKEMNESLQISLSAITTNYMRGNNTILRAVEETMPQMKGPVALVFKRFLVSANLVDSNVTDALYTMKDTVHSSIFAQWIDAVVRCQHDHSLKSTLPRILDKFSDVQTVMNETQLLMAEPKRTFFIMLGGAALSPFLLYFLNIEWWNIITTQTIGKILVAAHITGVFIALFLGLKAMRPLQAQEDLT